MMSTSDIVIEEVAHALRVTPQAIVEDVSAHGFERDIAIVVMMCAGVACSMILAKHFREESLESVRSARARVRCLRERYPDIEELLTSLEASVDMLFGARQTHEGERLRQVGC